MSAVEDAVVQLARKAARVANSRAESWDYHFEKMLVENGFSVVRQKFLGWSRLRPCVVRQILRYLIRAPDRQLLSLYVVLVVRVEPFAEETYSVECAMIDEP